MSHTPVTKRGTAKLERRTELLRAAGELFGRSGFANVSLEDLGKEVGISGPAVYRHFPNKSAVLATLLIDVSVHLLEGGQKVSEGGRPPTETLEDLVAFHADFAFSSPEVIRIQDREWRNLEPADLERVRDLQLRYISLWADQLEKLHPNETASDARFRARSVFGLLNSTPHTVGGTETKVSARKKLLSSLALAALTADA
ncbi:TetR/AcrR family transcriptional regulator [Neomicrococcus lactis]